MAKTNIAAIVPLLDFFQDGRVVYAAGTEYPPDAVLERMVARNEAQALPVRSLSKVEKAELARKAAEDAQAAELAAAAEAARVAAELALQTSAPAGEQTGAVDDGAALGAGGTTGSTDNPPAV